MVGLDRYRLLVQYCPRPNGLAERVSYNRGYRFVANSNISGWKRRSDPEYWRHLISPENWSSQDAISRSRTPRSWSKSGIQRKDS